MQLVALMLDAIRTQSKQLEALMRLDKEEETSLTMRKRLTDLRAVYDNLEDQESEYAKSVLSDINAMNGGGEVARRGSRNLLP